MCGACVFQYFSYNISVLHGLVNLVCVRTVPDVLQMLLLHLKQAGLQGMIPDCQNKFVRSLGALLNF